MAFVHVDQIQDFNLVALTLEEISGVSQNFSLRVKDHKATVDVDDVGFGEEPRFTGTTSATYQCVQISSVLASIQSDCYILCQNLILYFVGIGISFVDLTRLAPFGRAVFLPSSVVAVIRQIYAYGQTVD